MIPEHLIDDSISQREIREGRKPLGYGVVNHPDEFYNGREVAVWSRQTIAGVVILSVTLPTGTGSGRFEWPIREDRLANFVEVNGEKT
jgi:hypothetical protein